LLNRSRTPAQFSSLERRLVEYLDRRDPRLTKVFVGMETVDHPSDAQLAVHARKRSCGDRPDAVIDVGFGVRMSIVRSTYLKWQRHLVLGDDWRILVRPIRPDDEFLIRDLLVHVTKEDLRLRFFDSIKEFSPRFIAKLTKLDYPRAMAFLALDEPSSEMLGVVWLYSDSAHEAGEYAILLRSDLKGRGLGWALMQLIIEYAKSEGLKQISGQVLQENGVMLKMCRELGFKVKTDAKDRGVCDVTLVIDR
jgi:GNAT superfamily N-acetyltransferase